MTYLLVNVGFDGLSFSLVLSIWGQDSILPVALTLVQEHVFFFANKIHFFAKWGLFFAKWGLFFLPSGVSFSPVSTFASLRQSS